MTKDCDHDEPDILINGVCINCGTCDLNKMLCDAARFAFNHADIIFGVCVVLYLSIRFIAWWMTGFQFTV